MSRMLSKFRRDGIVKWLRCCSSELAVSPISSIRSGLVWPGSEPGQTAHVSIRKDRFTERQHRTRRCSLLVPLLVLVPSRCRGWRCQRLILIHDMHHDKLDGNRAIVPCAMYGAGRNYKATSGPDLLLMLSRNQ